MVLRGEHPMLLYIAGHVQRLVLRGARVRMTVRIQHDHASEWHLLHCLDGIA